jgi:hypothetical protein
MDDGHQQSVEWGGDYWLVADARYDDSGMATGSHWHVTFVGPLEGEALRDAVSAAEVRRGAACARRNPRRPQ